MRPRPPSARTARPVLAGILVGLVAAGVVVAVRAERPPAATASPVSSAAPAPGGAQFDDDHLLPCGPVVARLAPRDRLAQRLVVGIDAARPAAVVDAVRATQVG